MHAARLLIRVVDNVDWIVREEAEVFDYIILVCTPLSLELEGESITGTRLHSTLCLVLDERG